MKKIVTLISLLLCLVVSSTSAATVNVTYRYMHGSNVWYTETKAATVGEAYPEVIAQPVGVKYLTTPLGTVTGATTVDIECVYTNKAVSSSLADNQASAPWCFLTIRDSHLRYVSGQGYTTVNTSQTTRPAATDYSYQWAIFGNPIQGFKIVNRQAGSAMILTSPAPTGDGGTTYPIVATESGINTSTHNLYWDLTVHGTAFYLSRHGETVYANHYASKGKLAFWTSSDVGSQIGITKVDETLTATTTFDTGKYYMLVNRSTGAALGEGPLRNYNASVSSGTDVYEENVALPMEASTSNHAAIWQLEKSGTGYKLKNYSTGNYLNNTCSTHITAKGIDGAAWYYVLKTDGEAVYYFVRNGDGYYNLTTTTSTATGTSEKIALCDDGYMAQIWTTYPICAEWELREVTPTSATPTYATAITSGRYYRFINNSYPTLAMTEDQQKVGGKAIDENSYAQIWKVTRTNNNYTLQNALTGRYIQTNPGTSTQFSTGTTSRNFLSGTSTSGGNTLFTFYTSSTSSNTSLHCASSQSYNVVGWAATSDASKWLLQEVTLSSEDLAAIEATRAIANGTGTNYTTQLSNFFSDYACTTLKSTYQNYTDTQLRSAMSSLPTDLQEMAVRVKNNTWNSESSTGNHYEKDFRIHDYEIYSDCTLWKTITGIGPFAHLTNPTGIQGKPGDVIYLFVGSNVQDSDATLQAELVEGTNTTGVTVTLSRGYNALYINSECEVFISYLLNNTSKSCNNYPDITVHIEGGTCNGFFDMHRGHTNNDWIWMKENMFQNKYLHVKGNSVLLNVCRADVYAEQNATGVMKIWDFIFDTEERFAGCDQWKATGQYKMMINSFHNINENDASRYNPYWNGVNHGTSHPDLTATGTFNYNGLSNSGLWEIAHEIGHGHQNPIKSAGTDETSNNVMSQIIQFLPKDHISDGLFQSARATRGDGVKKLTEYYNDGMSYIDMIRRRIIVSGIEGNDNISNRWLFQLWMYYDYLGHYQPTGGNNGFAFVSALYDKLRASGLGTGTTVTPAEDYLLMAKYCAEIVETDLSEFFEVWGFWRTTPKYAPLTIPNENNNSSSTDSGTTYYAGGYTNRAFNMSSATSQVNTVRNAMKAYTKKGTNIVFIEDRGVGCTLSQTMEGLDPQTLGDHGYYADFDKAVTGEYEYTVDGTTVTMSGGQNAVGFKIYDAGGNLVALSSMDSFTVPEAVATGLTNGTYTLVAAQGNGTDVATTGDVTEPVEPVEQELYCIQSWRSYGFVKHNGDAAAVTQTLDYSDEATKFYFQPVNGTDWTAGVKIVSNVTGKQLVDVGTGFADSGTTWYIKENPYKAGFYCISKTSDLSSGCWDCSAAGAMTAAYWRPADGDADGTSWQIIRAEDLPQFQTSTLADPKWYYIKSGRSDRYLYANGTSLNTATTNAKSDAYKFAFIQTENNGVQVVNKAGLDSGSNPYLATTPGMSGTAATWYYYNYSKGDGYFMLAKEEVPLNSFTGNYFGGYDGSGAWNYKLLHVNGSGGLTYWWNDASGTVGNIYQIEEVVTTCDVTYTYIYNGTTYSATEKQNIGDAVSLPASITFPYTNYTFSAATVPNAATATINVTVTGFTDMPFETSSDYATATWYYLHGHASYTDRYISTNGDATVFSQGKGTTDAYKWAFIGNPIEGIKVINKATGDGKYLQGTDPAAMGATAKGWVLKQQTNTNWQCGASGFGLYEDESQNKYLNTQGSTLKYWGSFDQGSTFWVEEVPNNFAPDVVNEIGMFFADGATLDTYFTIPSATKAQWQSLYDQYSVNATEAQYHEIVDAVKAAIVYPEAGRYRIKSCRGRYITCTNNALVTTDNISDQNTIFTFTGTYPNFQLSVAGKNVQRFPAAYSQQATVSEDEGNTIVLSLINPGYVVFDNYYNQIFFHEDASYNVVGWYANAEASHWTIEDVALFGDVDGNGIVEYADLTTLVNILLDNTSRTDGADVNGDGNVTLADLTQLVNIIRSTNE